MSDEQKQDALGKSPRAKIIATLEKQQTHIMRGLPKHLSAERMMRVYQTAISKTPDLWECAPMTIVGSVTQASELGLQTNGVLGEAALVPFWNRKTQRKECQLMVMYRGYIELSGRAGNVEYVDAKVVYEGDIFEFEYGTDARLRHVPCWNKSKRGERLGAYALVKYKSGVVKFIVMSLDDIEEIRSCSKAKNAEAWTNWYDAMCQKTALRKLFKYERLSPEIARAVMLDEAIDGGVNPLSDIELPVYEAAAQHSDQQTEDLKERLAQAAAEGDDVIEGEAVVVDEDDVVIDPEESVREQIEIDPADPTCFGADSKFCEKVSELKSEFAELAESGGLDADETERVWKSRVMKALGEQGCTMMSELDQKGKNAIVKIMAAKVKAYREHLDEKEN